MVRGRTKNGEESETGTVDISMCRYERCREERKDLSSC